MTLEQILRMQAARPPRPQFDHVVVWNGVLDRRGQTFSLNGLEGWGQSQLHDAIGRVDQGVAGRVGASVR